MTLENPAALIAALGLVCAIATFFIGRTSKAREEGREFGSTESRLKVVERDIADVRTVMHGFATMPTQIALLNQQIPTLVRQIDLFEKSLHEADLGGMRERLATTCAQVEEAHKEVEKLRTWRHDFSGQMTPMYMEWQQKRGAKA